jgi:hypothetical protein
MAESQTHEGRDEKSPPLNGQADPPADLEAALARLSELERKHGSLLNENKRIKTAREELTEKLKKWNGLEDLDPEQVKVWRAERQQADHERARESGDLDKLIANARSAAEKERDQERALRVKAEALVQRKMVDDELNNLLEKYVDPRYKKAVFAMLRGRFETLEDPEDEYGIRAVVKVDDAYMSAGEFIKYWAETDEESVPFLKPSLATGGGAAGGAGAGRARMKPRSKMSAKEKSDLISEIGKARYEQIPWE